MGDSKILINNSNTRDDLLVEQYILPEPWGAGPKIGGGRIFLKQDPFCACDLTSLVVL